MIEFKTILLDPELPDAFDSNPMNKRSKEELGTWFDVPYAVTQSDGSLIVRCLDGSAWDRSSNYGHVRSISEALVLANKKFREIQIVRARPILRLDGPLFVVSRVAWRHDKPEVILGRFNDLSSAHELYEVEYKKVNDEFNIEVEPWD